MSKLTLFPFATLSTDTIGHERTLPVRLNDIYNVKDYGAVADVGTVGFASAHDDTAAIQATINDTGLAGVIFFPPGIYKITSPIVAPDRAGGVGRHRMLIFRGCGCNIAAGTGSILQASMADYIYYGVEYPYFGGYRNTFVLEGLGFHNDGGVIPTSTESPSNPNPDQPGGTGVAAGNGSGCLNLQGDAYLDVHNCEFKIDKGICFNNYGQNARISNCIFRGGFAVGDGATNSIGMINMETVENCKFYNLGTALVSGAHNGLLVAKNLDFFHCGTCMEIGSVPIIWWNTNDHLLMPVGNAPCKASYLNNIRMRSFSIYGMHILAMDYSVAEGIIIESDGTFGTPISGVQTGASTTFRSGVISGTYSTAALDCSLGQANFFYNFDVTCSGPGAAYLPRNFSSSDIPNFFTNCNFDTSQSRASLPSNPPWLWQSVIVNDSPDLSWNSATGQSNVGKACTFGGSFKVAAFFNGSTWCIAG